MAIFSRDYTPNDFDAVMSFLRDIYAETGSFDNWLPPHLENSQRDLFPGTRIWEESRPSQRIVAVANPERKFLYFIQVHPDNIFIMPEIVGWIEDYCAAEKPDPDEELQVSIVTLEGTLYKETVLSERGFEKGRVYGVLRTRDVNALIPDYQLPEGYSIRSVIPETDFPRLVEAIMIVFGHGESFNVEVLEWLSKRSFYVPELDLVVVAPDRSIASFCTFRVDPPSRVVELEPMGTLPGHRRRGLAKAIIAEGLRRLRKHDPSLLYLGGAADTPEANRLYEVTGYSGSLRYYYWHKTI